MKKETKMMDFRALDEFELNTADENVFENAVFDMEENSDWIPSDRHNVIIHGLSVPMDIEPFLEISPGTIRDVAMECQETGTQLYAEVNGENYLLDMTCKSSLTAAAGISGPALPKIDPIIRADIYNRGLDVGREMHQVLIRYGKIGAIQSSKYRQMPMGVLVETCFRVCGSKLGRMIFKSGHLDHGYMSVIWDLEITGKDVADKANPTLPKGHTLLDPKGKYKLALGLTTSDTSLAKACIVPYMNVDGTYMRIGMPGGVRHEMEASKDPMVRFEEACDNIFPRFVDCMKEVQALERITLRYPENAMINATNYVKLSRKEGTAALEHYRGTKGRTATATAAELYMHFAAALQEAMERKVSAARLGELEDKISLLCRADWALFDSKDPAAWSVF